MQKVAFSKLVPLSIAPPKVARLNMACEKSAPLNAVEHEAAKEEGMCNLRRLTKGYAAIMTLARAMRDARGDVLIMPGVLLVGMSCPPAYGAFGAKAT